MGTVTPRPARRYPVASDSSPAQAPDVFGVSTIKKGVEGIVEMSYVVYLRLVWSSVGDAYSSLNDAAVGGLMHI